MLASLAAVWRRIYAVSGLERTICRLLAAWSGCVAVSLWIDDSFGLLTYGQDVSLVSFGLWIVLLFVVYTCIATLCPRYETDSWALLVGATSCVIPWLTSFGKGANYVMFLLAVIVAYGFFLVYFIKKNETLWKNRNPGNRVSWLLVIGIGVVSGGILATITGLRYLTFSSPNFDFGIFVNMFHHMKESGLPLCSCERDVLLTHFAVHLSPIYYLMLPFYMLFPSPLTLQIGQAVVLASGVIPVYLLCKHFRLSGKVSILMTALYALYPALSTGCFYDLHENCFLAPLLLWVFYCLEREKYGWMYVAAFLTLMVKEDAAVYVAMLALYVLLSKRKWLHGSVLLVGSLAYFGIALWLLKDTAAHYAQVYANATPNPSIDGPMINRFDNLILNQEDGLGGVLKTALVNPGYLLTQLFGTYDGSWNKILYALQLFLPLGFLPFSARKPSYWLLLVPVLINLVTQYGYQYDIGFQYHFGITAFLVYASILHLSEMKGRKRRYHLSFAVAACCCMYITYVMSSYTYYTEAWQAEKEQYTLMEALLDTVPEDASVNCSTFLLPHIADRDEIYELEYHGAVDDVDYVVLDNRWSGGESWKQQYLELGYVVETDFAGLIVMAKPAAP